MTPAVAREIIDGVLLLDKPRGLTSQQAVSRVKRLFQAKKAGHTGTLDPLADGLLPVGFGEATKFSQFLLDADKAYRATLCLGTTTSTGDAEGEVLEQRAVAVTEAQIAAVTQRFTGSISQTPPMHAAIKVRGKPLYAYARAGESVVREPRLVSIHEIQVIDYKDKYLKIRISCSKGTYIRVLAEDIGAALGCGAHLTALTREHAGEFALKDAVSLDVLEALTLSQRRERLWPLDAFAASLNRLNVAPEDERRIIAGQQVELGDAAAPGLCRLYGATGAFFGIGEVIAGVLVARRLIAQQSGDIGLSNSVVTG